MGERSQGKLTLEELLHAAGAPILDVSDGAMPDEPVSDLLRDLLGGGADESRDDGGLLEQLQDLPRIPVAAAPSEEKPEERADEPAAGEPPAGHASGKQPAAEPAVERSLAGTVPVEAPLTNAMPFEDSQAAKPASDESSGDLPADDPNGESSAGAPPADTVSFGKSPAGEESAGAPSADGSPTRGQPAEELSPKASTEELPVEPAVELRERPAEERTRKRVSAKEPCTSSPVEKPAAKQGEPTGQSSERPSRRLGRHAAGTSASRARRREAERQQAVSRSALESPKQPEPSFQLALEPISPSEPAPQSPAAAAQREHASQRETVPKDEARLASAPLTLSDLTAAVEPLPSPASAAAPEQPRRPDARGAQLRALRQQLERRMRDLAAGETSTPCERIRRETLATGNAANKMRPAAASENAADRPSKGPAHARPTKCAPSRSRRLKVAAATAGVLVLVAFLATAFGLAGAPFGFPSLPGDTVFSTAPSETDAGGAVSEGRTGSAAGDSSSDEAKGESGSGSPASSGKAGAPQTATEDRSGTVVYRYTALSADGMGSTVVETVRFGRDGLCETSTMEAAFADGLEAEAFLETLRRDYGPAFEDGATEGSTATATLDVSANKLDREAYEDALRDSVEDLSIVRKS